MTENEREMMLDLLCDKFVYGLSEEEAKKLAELGYNPKEAGAIEMTVAALSMADLETEEMPAGVHSELQDAATDCAGGTRAADAERRLLPKAELVRSSGASGSSLRWLG